MKLCLHCKNRGNPMTVVQPRFTDTHAADFSLSPPHMAMSLMDDVVLPHIFDCHVRLSAHPHTRRFHRSTCLSLSSSVSTSAMSLVFLPRCLLHFCLCVGIFTVAAKIFGHVTNRSDLNESSSVVHRTCQQPKTQQQEKKCRRSSAMREAFPRG